MRARTLLLRPAGTPRPVGDLAVVPAILDLSCTMQFLRGPISNLLLCCWHPSPPPLLNCLRSFLKDGVWHTWIDYDKFQRLAASGQPFTSTGAMGPRQPGLPRLLALPGVSHGCCCLRPLSCYGKHANRQPVWLECAPFPNMALLPSIKPAPLLSPRSLARADYSAPTPSWAVFGSAEAGFDPEQQRWRRVKGVGKFIVS